MAQRLITRFLQTEDEQLFNELLSFLVSLDVITPEERADRVKGPIVFKPGVYSHVDVIDLQGIFNGDDDDDI